nr:hypothetical protein [Tanacetum cinerariifolium]
MYSLVTPDLAFITSSNAWLSGLVDRFLAVEMATYLSAMGWLDRRVKIKPPHKRRLSSRGVGVAGAMSSGSRLRTLKVKTESVCAILCVLSVV